MKSYQKRRQFVLLKKTFETFVVPNKDLEFVLNVFKDIYGMNSIATKVVRVSHELGR